MDPTDSQQKQMWPVYDAEGRVVRFTNVATYTYDPFRAPAPEADEPIYREDERKPQEDDQKPPG